MTNKIFIFLFTLILLGGCKTSMQTLDNSAKSGIRYSVQLASGKGGIVENTHMEDIEGAGLDAFTGATRHGVSAGARAALPVGKHFLEAGLDYMYSDQTFTFSDAQNQYTGTRRLGLHQIMLPTTFSVSLFRKNHPNGLFQLKAGHLLQFNNVMLMNESGSLPAYDHYRWSNGFLFGLHLAPVMLSNGSQLGFFIEGYRGSQIYEDHYNQKEFEMPGSAFSRVGVIYYF